jgi:hypothetical protein
MNFLWEDISGRCLKNRLKRRETTLYSCKTGAFNSLTELKENTSARKMWNERNVSVDFS